MMNDGQVIGRRSRSVIVWLTDGDRSFHFAAFFAGAAAGSATA